MRSLFLMTIVMLLLIGLACNNLTENSHDIDDDGNNNTPTPIDNDVTLPTTDFDPITMKKNNVSISVDPRIELLSVIQYLSNYRSHPAMTRHNFAYRSSVEDEFDQFSSHPAVVRVEKVLVPRGFTYHIPPASMLYLTQDLEVNSNLDIPLEVLQRVNGFSGLEYLATLLQDFSNETNFQEFFANNSELYYQSVKNIANIMGETDFVAEMQEYFGMEYNSFNIILAPLYHGGYGVWTTSGEQIDIYSIIGSQGQADAHIRFGVGFKELVRHEFSHSFVNRVTDMYWTEAKRYSHLYNPIRVQMSNMGYGNWYSCLNEHIVRAVTTRLAYRESPRAGERALQQELNSGFIYVELVLDKLIEYEANREIYPSFTDFYPHLLKAFDELENQ